MVTQLENLDRLIAKATAAREAASAGNLFVSVEGQALVNAMYDLTEIDAFYEVAEKVAADMATDPDDETWAYADYLYDRQRDEAAAAHRVAA